MEFKLPFPTLKSLSCLRICLHWADHKFGPFEDFPATWSTSETISTRREKYSYLSIDGLPIPRSLKEVVGDVLFGVLKQLLFWRKWRVIRLSKEVQLFRFDVFGRFDEKQTLQPVFQKTVAEEDDLNSLYSLLTQAHDVWLLPEVDAILRKMVAIASKGSEILMEGPQPEFLDGKYHLVYRFNQEDAAQSLKNTRFSSCTDPITILVERNSITVFKPRPYSTKWNFDAFKDHLDLLEPSEREAFIKHTMSQGNIFIMGIKNLLDIFTFLNQNDHQKWMMELSQGLFRSFFEQLLVWPFTSLFVVTFRYLAPHMDIYIYPMIFSIIVERMPVEQEYGVLYGNLLVDYCTALTADEKRMCTFIRNFLDKQRVKAPFLPDAIITKLDSLMAATYEEVLPKRRRLR